MLVNHAYSKAIFSVLVKQLMNYKDTLLKNTLKNDLKDFYFRRQ